ncbi:MAG TPA: hypothetical protein VK457_22600 [Chloroflexota bacterium]|nr:hypothetical protein [Chloroflexota bacterium]
MRTSGAAHFGHMALIGFLIASGVLMAVAMIPLIMLILIGWGIFSITTPRKPRELTRRTVLGAAANGH